MSELRDLEISKSRIVPARLLQLRFSRAGGPGGQNVNKLATKVDLRLDLEAARETLGEAGTRRVRERLSSRLDAMGWLQVTSTEHRTRGRNIEAALARMEALLREALRPRRVRRPTRPTRASKERRLADKQRRSGVKRGRRPRSAGDDD
jgi:ribosome-associated protein